MGRFPVAAASRTCLARLYWDILGTCPNHRSWELSVRNSRFSRIHVRFFPLLRVWVTSGKSKTLTAIFVFMRFFTQLASQFFQRLVENGGSSERIRCLNMFVIFYRSLMILQPVWIRSSKTSSLLSSMLNETRNGWVHWNISSNYFDKLQSSCHVLIRSLMHYIAVQVTITGVRVQQKIL